MSSHPSVAEPPVLPVLPRRRIAIFLKLAGIGLLIALLHIPLLLTRGILNERQQYRAQAVDEIAGIWGRSQIVTGPVLVVPYAYKAQVIRSRVVGGRKVDIEETELTPALAYFLPESLQVAGSVEPEVRHRGIYDAIVYSTKLKLSGRWAPDFAAAGIVADRIDWEKARVQLGVSDLRGVRMVGPLQLNGTKTFPFESAEASALLPLEAKLEGAAAGQALEFACELAVNGSDALSLVPVGKTTSVALESPWADPSFMGAYLPVERAVGDKGFKARWETSHFSRGFPGSWSDRDDSGRDIRARLDSSAFGVRFAQLVDSYSLVARAQKYGVLFFTLVFAVFFVFEVTLGLRIHPLQYLMVGAALCLFFLGYLALSEFWTGAVAYGVPAAACTLLIAAYTGSFLGAGWRSLTVGVGLGATYGYLYFVLQSQDYALLAGTAALFAVLALVMFLTRRVSWYQLDPAPQTNAA